MKKLLVFVIVFVSLSAFSQELTKGKIDSEYQETLKNLDIYKQVLIVDTIQEGTIDTVFYYINNKMIKYINHVSVSGGLAMVEGRSQDVFFYIEGNLVLKRYFARSDRLEYGNS